MGVNDTSVNSSLNDIEDWEEYGFQSEEEYEMFDYAISMVREYPEYRNLVKKIYNLGKGSYENYNKIINRVHAMEERSKEWNSKIDKEKKDSENELNNIWDKIHEIRNNGPYGFMMSRSFEKTNIISTPNGGPYKNKFSSMTYGGIGGDEINGLKSLPKLKPKQTYTLLDKKTGGSIQIGFKEQQNLNIYSKGNTVYIEAWNGGNGLEAIRLTNTDIYLGKTSKNPTKGKEGYENKSLNKINSQPISKYEGSFEYYIGSIPVGY